MKTKPMVLAALVLTAVFVGGESVVALDRVGHAVSVWSARVHSHAASVGATVVVKTIVSAFTCAAKS